MRVHSLLGLLAVTLRDFPGVTLLEQKLLHRFQALTFLAIFFAGFRVQARPIVWVVPALTRVGPEEAAQYAGQIVLYAGRGEYESFQVIVRGPAGGLAGAMISASGLVGPEGRTISRANIRLYREQYVQITRGSPDRGGTNRPLGPGWYADALIPVSNASAGSDGSLPEKNIPWQTATAFTIEEGKNQPFWIDIFVPRTAASGEYRGAVEVTDKQGKASVRVTLHVWNFELPLHEEYGQFILDLLRKSDS